MQRLTKNVVSLIWILAFKSICRSETFGCIKKRFSYIHEKRLSIENGREIYSMFREFLCRFEGAFCHGGYSSLHIVWTCSLEKSGLITYLLTYVLHAVSEILSIALRKDWELIVHFKCWAHNELSQKVIRFIIKYHQESQKKNV